MVLRHMRHLRQTFPIIASTRARAYEPLSDLSAVSVACVASLLRPLAAKQTITAAHGGVPTIRPGSMNMAKQPDSTAPPKPKPVEIILDEAETDTLRPIGGSRSRPVQQRPDRGNGPNRLVPVRPIGRRSQPATLRRGHRPAGIQGRRRDRGHDCRTGDGGAPRIDGMQPPGDASRSAV